MRVQCTRSARIPPQSVVLEVAGFQGSQESSHLTGVVRKYTHNVYEGSKEAHPLNPQKEGMNKGAGWTGVARSVYGDDELLPKEDLFCFWMTKSTNSSLCLCGCLYLGP